MTKAEFKKQLNALCRQMMVENTGYKSYSDYSDKAPDFCDCQTEEEENEWEALDEKVTSIAEWIDETLTNCDSYQ